MFHATATTAKTTRSANPAITGNATAVGSDEPACGSTRRTSPAGPAREAKYPTTAANAIADEKAQKAGRGEGARV